MPPQLFPHGDEQLNPAYDEVLEHYQAALDNAGHAALEHVRKTLVRVVNNRLASKHAEDEAERQRIEVVAMDGIERRPESAPEHLHVQPDIEDHLGGAAAVGRGDKYALDLHAFHDLGRGVLKIAVPCEKSNATAHRDQRHRFLPDPRVRSV